MKTAIILLACFTAVYSWPGGGRVGQCFTLLPNHGMTAHTTLPPVRIVLSSTNISPGETITITVESINTSYEWRGYMLQPRNVVYPNSPVGTILPGDNVNVLTCSDGDNTATHTGKTF